MNNTIAKPRHGPHIRGQAYIHDAMRLEQIEGFCIGGGDPEIVGGADLGRNIDRRLDGQLHCVQHRVLALTVLQECVLRNRR